MTAEEPLHVRVARALGWTDLSSPGACYDAKLASFGAPAAPWFGRPGRSIADLAGDRCVVPRYDTDWSATGPLIQTYGINVQDCRQGHGGWCATAATDRDLIASGSTALGAVCNVIVVLNATGRLRPAFASMKVVPIPASEPQ